MPNDDAKSTALSDDLLIDHADRIWNAEREIADRYSSRVRQIVAVATTLFAAVSVGLGGTLVKATTEDVPGWGRLIVVVCLVVPAAIAVLFLLRVPILLLHSSRVPIEAISRERKTLDSGKKNRRNKNNDKPQPTASHELDLPDEFLEWIVNNGNPPVVVVFAQIMHAAQDLRRRNLRERYRIEAGEIALSWGVRFTLVTAIVLLVFLAILFVVGGG